MRESIRKPLGALLAAGLLIGFACTNVTGSGKIITKPVAVSSFSRLQVSGVFDVTVTQGDSERVILRVDDNLLDRLDVGVSDQTLHIGLKSGTSVRRATLHANVTARALSGIEVSGASKVHLARELSGEDLDVSLSGSSRIDGPIACGRAGVMLSGASDARLSGRADVLVIEVSGASSVDAPQLQARDLTAHLSGASDATVWATTTISAEVSGASSLRYRGAPRFTRKDTSGASSIEPL